MQLLLIADSSTDAQAVCQALERYELSLQIEHVAPDPSMHTQLDGERIDLILLDLSSIEGEGEANFAALRAAVPDAPIITLGSQQEERLVTETAEDGVQARLVAGNLDPAVLARALGGALDRRRVQAQAGPRQDLLSDILEALTYPFYVIDVADYTVALANPVAAMSTDPVLDDTTCYAMTHNRQTPCDGRHHPCPLKEVAHTKEPVAVEHVHFDAEGNARHVEVHGYPILDDEGNVAQMIEYTLDITERKRAQEELRRERDLVAQLMETSPVSITMTDCDGQIVFANARAEDVLGLSRSEITDRSYDAPAWHIAGFDGEPFPNEELPFRQVMATKEPVYGVRHAIEWPDGRRRLLSVNGAPLLDQSGEVERVVFAIEDVTEQVQAERKRIRQLKRELHSLEEMATLPDTDVSARAFGVRPLREATADVFEDLTTRYGELMDQALDRQAYRTNESSEETTRTLVETLGTVGATPRDVIDVHIAALRQRTAQSNPLKAEAYAKEGRLIALQLMGDLVSYYRKRCVHLAVRGVDADQQTPTDEGARHHE